MTRAAIKSLDTRERTHFSELKEGDVFKLPGQTTHYMKIMMIEYINVVNLSDGSTDGFEDTEQVIPSRDVQFVITY